MRSGGIAKCVARPVPYSELESFTLGSFSAESELGMWAFEAWGQTSLLMLLHRGAFPPHHNTGPRVYSRYFLLLNRRIRGSFAPPGPTDTLPATYPPISPALTRLDRSPFSATTYGATTLPSTPTVAFLPSSHPLKGTPPVAFQSALCNWGK